MNDGLSTFDTISNWLAIGVLGAAFIAASVVYWAFIAYTLRAIVHFFIY